MFEMAFFWRIKAHGNNIILNVFERARRNSLYSSRICSDGLLPGSDVASCHEDLCVCDTARFHPKNRRVKLAATRKQPATPARTGSRRPNSDSGAAATKLSENTVDSCLERRRIESTSATVLLWARIYIHSPKNSPNSHTFTGNDHISVQTFYTRTARELNTATLSITTLKYVQSWFLKAVISTI